MQINNCNEPKPSFGMLKINKNYLKTLADKGDTKLLHKLNDIGKDLSDTKFYHLKIDENGARTIDSRFANKYVGNTFEVKEPSELTPEFMPYYAVWNGPEMGNLRKGNVYSDYIMFSNAKAAQEAYADISKSYGIDRDAKMVKYLDNSAIEKDNAYKAGLLKHNEASSLADDLSAKFGE